MGRFTGALPLLLADVTYGACCWFLQKRLILTGSRVVRHRRLYSSRDGSGDDRALWSFLSQYVPWHRAVILRFPDETLIILSPGGSNFSQDALRLCRDRL